MNRPKLTDELVARARKGSAAAFEEVVRLTYRQVYTQAVRLIGDRRDAEDVVQEAFLRAFRALPRFRGDAQLETWLHRIVANAAADHLRRRGRAGALILDSPANDATERPAEGVGLEEQATERHDLEAALQTLPVTLRVPVVLKDVYGLSCEEIADELEISEGAVKVRLHRGRRRLKDVLVGESRHDV